MNVMCELRLMALFNYAKAKFLKKDMVSTMYELSGAYFCE